MLGASIPDWHLIRLGLRCLPLALYGRAGEMTCVGDADRPFLRRERRAGMTKASPGLSTRLRRVRPLPSRPAIELRLGTFRPTALDMRFAGDAWIFDRGDGSLSVCVGNYSLARISALGLDLQSLNHLLEHVRRRGRCRRD
jgi:hypothetical protein